MSTDFSWIRSNWMEYKIPISEGSTLISHDFTINGFNLGPEYLNYSYDYSKKEKTRIADFAPLVDSLFFVNQHAFDCFQDMFIESGRVFPAQCDGRPHYIVLIDNLVDAVDLSRSQFRRSGLYEELLDDIVGVDNIVLKDNFCTDLNIFRLYGSFALGNHIVVSEKFRARYRAAGMTGLLFYSTHVN